MKIPFYKFDGAGNDFVLLDCRKEPCRLTEEQIRYVCDRHFGVGADGLMTLSASSKADFEMTYYNSDGRVGSMCGNGGRCITLFAYLLGIGGGKRSFDFVGYDGLHHAELLDWQASSGCGVVRLDMCEVDSVQPCTNRGLPSALEFAFDRGWVLDTGSPHLVVPVSNLRVLDVARVGALLRNERKLFPKGVNVDFVEMNGGLAMVRTFERGVEDETLACGTGVTAVALVAASYLGGGSRTENIVKVQTTHALFEVGYDRCGTEVQPRFRNVCLTGPVSFNFEGVLDDAKLCHAD